MSGVYALKPKQKDVQIPTDPNTFLHRRPGMFNRPSNNPMNFYSTAYSTTHDFKHADQPDSQLVEPPLHSGL